MENLSDILLKIARKFTDKKKELIEFKESGGMVEIFITFDDFKGAIIDGNILKSLGDLGFSLSLDRIYYDD